MTNLREQLQAGLSGSYVLERELGRGGMATVYLARDVKHDRPVALKVLLPELAATLGPDRFQREIRFAARLQHPHILTVHDSGETAGQLWFTMPYVEGESLRTRLRREGQLALK
ncbi:MAG TPA: protein kinase, partial [Gemmatimonadales bacterium]|nr:protein kinase [Gemmatimonadales bacterium]